jgi:catechol 2,3-dioxygenase-like lactoylglutathione lyase family enzyme
MVTDRNAVLKHFQELSMGVSVGPQPLMPHEDGEGALTYYRKLDGDPVTFTYPTGGAHNFKDGECQIGDCQLECYPMRPGPGMFFSEYLAQKGPGINHICFNVADIEGETLKLTTKGCDLVFNATVNGKTVENYLDTRRYGDVMISLRPPASAWELAWKQNNLAYPLVSNWKFRGVGISVSDMDKSVSYYQELGFDEVEPDFLNDQTIRSRKVQVGPLIFEFLQPTDNESVYQDSLDKRGDGINDLIFVVDDLEYETSKLVGNGAQVLRETGLNAGASVYFDTRAVGNLMTRLIQA